MYSKKRLVDAVALDLELPKKVAKMFIESTFDNLVRLALKDGLNIRGFGSFKIRDRKAFTVTTPQGKKKKVPAAKRMTFKFSQLVHEFVKKAA